MKNSQSRTRTSRSTIHCLVIERRISHFSPLGSAGLSSLPMETNLRAAQEIVAQQQPNCICPSSNWQTANIFNLIFFFFFLPLMKIPFSHEFSNSLSPLSLLPCAFHLDARPVNAFVALSLSLSRRISGHVSDALIYFP